jgi:hypothetical protein
MSETERQATRLSRRKIDNDAGHWTVTKGQRDVSETYNFLSILSLQLSALVNQ